MVVVIQFLFIFKGRRATASNCELHQGCCSCQVGRFFLSPLFRRVKSSCQKWGGETAIVFTFPYLHPASDLTIIPACLLKTDQHSYILSYSQGPEWRPCFSLCQQSSLPPQTCLPPICPHRHSACTWKRVRLKNWVSWKWDHDTQFAIADTQLALENGSNLLFHLLKMRSWHFRYPEQNMFKLLERKAQCLIQARLTLKEKILEI